ncbi:MAG: hypothetical protein L6422_06720 [Candidatus Marinimicrobia bacterium]|nr:hypothetical protein [bacterium]MCG2715961.1 hypothetical protein [Candidatus Neomarinimicrobiota bacterium]
MKRISIVILPIVLFQFCGLFHIGGISEALCQTLIPSWFEEIPKSPTGIMLSVGYCGKYQDKNLAKQVAINHALIIMAKQEQIRLIFEVEEFADGRLRLLNPTFEQFYEESILSRIMQDYKVLDSLSTEDGYFVLLSHPSSDRLSIKSTGGKSWGSQPRWTKELPGSKDFVYGIGMVGKYSSCVRAWKDADEYARFDLGKNIEIEAGSIHAVQRDNRFIIESKILRQSYDTTLKNSIIVARWYDAKEDIYYSLCRQSKPVSD